MPKWLAVKLKLASLVKINEAHVLTAPSIRLMSGPRDPPVPCGLDNLPCDVLRVDFYGCPLVFGERAFGVNLVYRVWASSIVYSCNFNLGLVYGGI